MASPKTCAFTGHRPAKLPFGSDEHCVACMHLKVLIYTEAENAIKDGYTHFICGCALGSDTYFAEAVIALRKRYPGITLEAALACETQAVHWPEEDRDRYFGILAQCDRETYVNRYYRNGCYLERNRYLVDRSQRLIAVYDGRFGGTMYTVNRAQARQLELVVIDPVALRVRASRRR